MGKMGLLLSLRVEKTIWRFYGLISLIEETQSL